MWVFDKNVVSKKVKKKCWRDHKMKGLHVYLEKEREREIGKIDCIYTLYKQVKHEETET